MCLRAPRQLRRRAIVHFYEIGGICFISAQQKNFVGKMESNTWSRGKADGCIGEKRRRVASFKIAQNPGGGLNYVAGEKAEGNFGRKTEFWFHHANPTKSGAGRSWRRLVHAKGRVKWIPSSRIQLRHRVALLELVRARENKLNGFRPLESRCGNVMLK